MYLNIRQSESVLCQTQKLDYLILLYRRKICQKVLDGITTLEIIEKILDRHTSPRKDGLAALNIGRNCDHLIHNVIVPNTAIKLNRQIFP